MHTLVTCAFTDCRDFLNTSVRVRLERKYWATALLWATRPSVLRHSWSLFKAERQLSYLWLSNDSFACRANSISLSVAGPDILAGLVVGTRTRVHVHGIGIGTVRCDVLYVAKCNFSNWYTLTQLYINIMHLGHTVKGRAQSCCTVCACAYLIT